jgi:hypothetical protein
MLMLMLGYGIYVYRSLEAVFFLGQYFVKFQPEKHDFNLLYRGFFIKKRVPNSSNFKEIHQIFMISSSR